MEKKPFKVGDVVALINSSGWGRSIGKTTVERVTPTGRFTVSGTSAKFRPDGSQVGDGYYRSHVEHWSDSHDAELEEQRVEKIRRRLADFSIWKPLSDDLILKVWEMVKDSRPKSSAE